MLANKVFSYYLFMIPQRSEICLRSLETHSQSRNALQALFKSLDPDSKP